MALGALALLTYWASTGLWSPQGPGSTAQQHLPDVSIDNFSARKLDRAGNVQYAVSAAKLVHYADNGSALASNIRFVSNLPGKPQLIAQAPIGTLRTGTDGEDEVELSGGVSADSAGTEKLPATRMLAPDMVLFPDRMIAQADHGVTLSSAGSQARADRMVLDADAGRIRLVNATATLERTRK